jgi:hypothetical protein
MDNDDDDDFTVYTGIEVLPDGEYEAELTEIEKRKGEYGRFIHLEWTIFSPKEFKDTKQIEKFNIGSQQYGEKAKNKFNRFWYQMTSDKIGDNFDFSKVKYKKAVLTIKNYEKGAFVIYRKLLKERTQLNQEKPFNDEIPF